MRNFIFEAKHSVVAFTRCVFSVLNDGESCVVCGKKTFFYPVCKSCLKKYFSVREILNSKRCSVCGKVLISTNGTCLGCREKKVLVHTDCVLPLFSYRLWNKELLFKWKIAEERSISALFAFFVSRALKKMNYNVVVPVPPRKGKIRKKGWDQIDELCNFLKNRYGVKVLNILKRNSLEQQKKLNRKERLETISSAYSLVSEEKLKSALKCVGNVLPEEVCIVDDVCTTGATIECCAEILKKNGIKKVNVITLFVVD